MARLIRGTGAKKRSMITDCAEQLCSLGETDGCDYIQQGYRHIRRHMRLLSDVN